MTSCYLIRKKVNPKTLSRETGSSDLLDREIRIVRVLDIDCFIDRTIERKKAECMHVRAGTNKDEVCLGRNTTPPSSWTAHADKLTNKEKQICMAYYVCKN